MNTSVSLADIKIDPAAQPRATIFTDKVSDYAERMALGDKFPPMVVFFDGHDYWLADGFHRYQAALGAGRDDFPCEVRSGGLRDAILFSCSANATHGIQRSQEDKRRAVIKLLQDEEWSRWSDREIAKQTGVSNTYVSKLRDELRFVTVNVDSEDRTYRTKHGTVSTMRTGNIGAPSKADEMSELPLAPGIVQDQTDQGNGNIWSGLRMIRFILAKMPPPDRAAERFPHFLRNTFTSANLYEMAEWLREFADHFTEKGKDDVAG